MHANGVAPRSRRAAARAAVDGRADACAAPPRGAVPLPLRPRGLTRPRQFEVWHCARRSTLAGTYDHAQDFAEHHQPGQRRVCSIIARTTCVLSACRHLDDVLVRDATSASRPAPRGLGTCPRTTSWTWPVPTSHPAHRLALTSVSDCAARLGAIQNRFDSTINSLQAVSENLSASRSRIQDTDFALRRRP
jgi:hypothetical protein